MPPTGALPTIPASHREAGFVFFASLSASWEVSQLNQAGTKGFPRGWTRLMTSIEYGDLACCRFHRHRVKVFLLKPESMNAKKEIQPRVQA